MIIGKTETFIKNSWDPINKIKNIHILNDSRIVSSDVKSLFVNIPKDLVLKNMKFNWHKIRDLTTLSDYQFLESSEFYIDSSYCVFQGQYYKQVFGTQIGSPLSIAISDPATKKLMNDVLKKLDTNIFSSVGTYMTFSAAFQKRR